MVVNMKKNNILVLFCDQFRFDCIHSLGNSTIKTPNIDRLVQLGTTFDNAYSTCPVCVAARYSVMSGCNPGTTGCFANDPPIGRDGLPEEMEERCGQYLARYMTEQGYRTFGIGKFHTKPDCYEDLGFETHYHTEELWESVEIKEKDAYAGEILKNHPEYAHIDQLHGERTHMYYVPQMSPLPAELTVEAFVTDLTLTELRKEDERPYFGYISFVGPHPPCAPPAPYHLMYNPDVMENPYTGEQDTDWMDEQIKFMNFAIWADDISNGSARNLKAHYYAEITYIDDCIGRILDELESKGELENTVICFTADHGDHLGDHGAWQKESFFEQSTRVPFIVCAPDYLKQDTRTDDLVSLTDLYSIVTKAAGCYLSKEGVDILGGEKHVLIFGTYGIPGTPRFKTMIRKGQYKYIYMSNGGREQLFDVENDPKEINNLATDEKYADLMDELRTDLYNQCNRPGLLGGIDGDKMCAFPYEERELKRIHQFEFSKNITDFDVSVDNFFVSP